MQLDSEIIGTTDASSPKWDNIHYNKAIQALMQTLNYPVYHTLRFDHEDMGYDHKGRRAPYISEIDFYVWTTNKEGMPIVNLYEIDPRSKHSFLKATYADYENIKYLSVEEPYGAEQDDEFARVYDAMCRILDIPSPVVFDESKEVQQERVEEPVATLFSYIENVTLPCGCISTKKRSQCKGHDGWTYT
jgi:hypothetical protein